jgi:colanic acid/amylovoran biosynthesis glycosyltransferase
MNAPLPPAATRSAAWSVALMVHHFPLISETFVATLAAALLPRVGDLRLLATSGEVAPGPHHPVVARAGLLDRLQVSRRAGRIDPRDMWRLGAGAPGRRAFLMALAAADLAVPREKLALTRMLSRQPAFDVVHCQFGYEGLAALRHRRMGTLRTGALVTHFRGSDITRHVRERGEGVYAELFAEGDGFVANCAHFRDEAVRLGCPPERIAIVGSPIDTARFAPPDPPRAAPGGRPLRLVAVGRLVDKKGFGDAVAAVAALADLDVRLDILGEGPLRPALERQIAQGRLGGRVALRGAATSGEVIAALHAADIALAPSVRAGDGDADAPVNTLKEAMATELPVIATRHGGIPELVIPGENGALVPERAPDALAAAIRDLAARPEDWPRLGRAGRRKVIDEYGLDRVAERTLAAYAAALDHARTRKDSR